MFMSAVAVYTTAARMEISCGKNTSNVWSDDLVK